MDWRCLAVPAWKAPLLPGGDETTLLRAARDPCREDRPRGKEGGGALERVGVGVGVVGVSACVASFGSKCPRWARVIALGGAMVCGRLAPHCRKGPKSRSLVSSTCLPGILKANIPPSSAAPPHHHLPPLGIRSFTLSLVLLSTNTRPNQSFQLAKHFHDSFIRTTTHFPLPNTPSTTHQS